MSILPAAIGVGALIATGVAMCRLSAVALAWVSGSKQRRIFDIAPPLPVARELPARIAGGIAPLLVPVLLFFFALLVGGEAVPTNRVRVNTGPAQQAGISDGDRVVSVNDQATPTWEAYRLALKAHHARDVSQHVSSSAVDIGVVRGAEPAHFTIIPNADGYLRLTPTYDHRSLSVRAALKQSVTQTISMWVGFLGATRDPKSQVIGPIGLVKETEAPAERGASEFAYFTASAGAYFVPAFLVAQLFDWLMLAVFLRLNPEVGDPHGAPAQAWRVARCRQLLLVTLVVLVVGTLFGVLVPASFPLASPILAWYVPVLVPLTWIISRATLGLTRTLLIQCALVIPLLNLAVLWYVSQAARNYMRQHGLRPVTLRITPPNERDAS
ncbi:MAG: M50 family metallopeptidase [Pseudomonadota bacterium]